MREFSEIRDQRDTIALRMRIEGATYSEIAKRIGKSETLVRKWFVKGQRLHEPYQKVLKNLQHIGRGTIEHVWARLKDLAPEAMDKLAQAIRDEDPRISYTASIKLIEILKDLQEEGGIGTTDVVRVYVSNRPTSSGSVDDKIEPPTPEGQSQDGE